MQPGELGLGVNRESESLFCCWCGVVLCPSMVTGDHGVVGVVGVVVVAGVSLLDEVSGVADWMVVVSGLVAGGLNVVAVGVVVGVLAVDSSESGSLTGGAVSQRPLTLVSASR